MGHNDQFRSEVRINIYLTFLIYYQDYNFHSSIIDSQIKNNVGVQKE